MVGFCESEHVNVLHTHFKIEIISISTTSANIPTMMYDINKNASGSMSMPMLHWISSILSLNWSDELVSVHSATFTAAHLTLNSMLLSLKCTFSTLTLTLWLYANENLMNKIQPLTYHAKSHLLKRMKNRERMRESVCEKNCWEKHVFYNKSTA